MRWPQAAGPVTRPVPRARSAPTQQGHDRLRRAPAPVRRRPCACLLAGALLAGCAIARHPPFSTEGADLLASAPKPPPLDSVFRGCGPAGSEPDHTLNLLKNRVDEGSYLPVPWPVVARLPWPAAVDYRFRALWTSGERSAVQRFEGAALSVEGYAAAAGLEPPEPTNCYARAADRRDVHLWLAARPADAKAQSIVTEVTPRLRTRHPGWTPARLATLARARARIRVSGWLMLDQMHAESIGRVRVTLWEIHPATRIDVWRDGVWVPLDSLP